MYAFRTTSIKNNKDLKARCAGYNISRLARVAANVKSEIVASTPPPHIFPLKTITSAATITSSTLNENVSPVVDTSPNHTADSTTNINLKASNKNSRRRSSSSCSTNSSKTTVPVTVSNNNIRKKPTSVHPSVREIRKKYPHIKFPQIPLRSHFGPYITLLTDEVDDWFKERNYSSAAIEMLKTKSAEYCRSVEDTQHRKRPKSAVTETEIVKLSPDDSIPVRKYKRIKLNHEITMTSIKTTIESNSNAISQKKSDIESRASNASKSADIFGDNANANSKTSEAVIDALLDDSSDSDGNADFNMDINLDSSSDSEPENTVTSSAKMNAPEKTSRSENPDNIPKVTPMFDISKMPVTVNRKSVLSTAVEADKRNHSRVNTNDISLKSADKRNHSRVNTNDISLKSADKRNNSRVNTNDISLKSLLHANEHVYKGRGRRKKSNHLETTKNLQDQSRNDNSNNEKLSKKSRTDSITSKNMKEQLPEKSNHLKTTKNLQDQSRNDNSKNEKLSEKSRTDSITSKNMKEQLPDDASSRNSLKNKSPNDSSTNEKIRSQSRNDSSANESIKENLPNNSTNSESSENKTANKSITTTSADDTTKPSNSDPEKSVKSKAITVAESLIVYDQGKKAIPVEIPKPVVTEDDSNMFTTRSFLRDSLSTPISSRCRIQEVNGTLVILSDSDEEIQQDPTDISDGDVLEIDTATDISSPSPTDNNPDTIHVNSLPGSNLPDLTLVSFKDKTQTLYTCKVCDSQHSSRKDLKQHQKRRHTKCPFCNKRFRSLSKRDEHVKSNCNFDKPPQLKNMKLCLMRVDEDENIRTMYPSAFESNTCEENDVNTEICSMKISNVETVKGPQQETDIIKEFEQELQNLCKGSDTTNQDEKESSDVDVICISDDETEKSKTSRKNKQSLKPKINIVNGDILQNVNLHDTDVNVLKNILTDTKMRTVLRDGGAVSSLHNSAIVDGCTSRVKIFKNLRKHLQYYKIPIEVKYSPALSVEYKPTRVPVAKNVTDLWYLMVPEDLKIPSNERPLLPKQDAPNLIVQSSSTSQQSAIKDNSLLGSNGKHSSLNISGLPLLKPQESIVPNTSIVSSVPQARNELGFTTKSLVLNGNPNLCTNTTNNNYTNIFVLQGPLMQSNEIKLPATQGPLPLIQSVTSAQELGQRSSANNLMLHPTIGNSITSLPRNFMNSTIVNSTNNSLRDVLSSITIPEELVPLVTGKPNAAVSKGLVSISSSLSNAITSGSSELVPIGSSATTATSMSSRIISVNTPTTTALVPVTNRLVPIESVNTALVPASDGLVYVHSSSVTNAIAPVTIDLDPVGSTIGSTFQMPVICIDDTEPSMSTTNNATISMQPVDEPIISVQSPVSVPQPINNTSFSMGQALNTKILPMFPSDTNQSGQSVAEIVPNVQQPVIRVKNLKELS